MAGINEQIIRQSPDGLQRTLHIPLVSGKQIGPADRAGKQRIAGKQDIAIADENASR